MALIYFSVRVALRVANIFARFALCYFCVVCVFRLLVVRVRLSEPIQVIDWKDSRLRNVLMGSLNPLIAPLCCGYS